MTARVTITVLGTTDLHGHALDWDYLRDAPYADDRGHHVGLARCASVIRAVRADRGPERCLTVDVGDTLQGTPLATHFAQERPVTGTGDVHPMAAALNAVGYDAAAIGNHEFDFGLDLVDAYADQLDCPLLCGNAFDAATGEHRFRPWTMRTVEVSGAAPVPVAVIGLVTPGVAVWNHGRVDGAVRFEGVVEQAQVLVPQVRAAGADVVVIACHSGADGPSSYGDALPFEEHAATRLAREVDGIDAVLVGHAHRDIPEHFVTHQASGRGVLLSEPLCWGMRVSVMDLDLVHDGARWVVESSRATTVDPAGHDEDAAVVDAVQEAHDQVRAHVNVELGRSLGKMSAATAGWADTAALRLVAQVQADVVAEALRGTPDADATILSVVAPSNRDGVLPTGVVRRRHVAGLYTFDNTLAAIRLTGAQVRDHLEHAARYFRAVPDTAPRPGQDVANAPDESHPWGVPDFDADQVFAPGHRLRYDVDLARPVGDRIRGLRLDGTLVRDDQQFVVALNSYRRAGGGGFPHVADAEVVLDTGLEIRPLVERWIRAQSTVDPAYFPVGDWRLMHGGAVLRFESSTGVG